VCPMFLGRAVRSNLHADGVPRALTSVDARLATLSGDGRLIVTASGPTEPAYESPHLRHGFLTYYLLEALEGAKEVEEAGRVPVYRLLEYVTRRVVDAATKLADLSTQRSAARSTVSSFGRYSSPGRCTKPHFPSALGPSPRRMS
jgi:uncharacterized caspase-like protein